MAAQIDPIMEERQDELMISPKGGMSTSKTAHFIKPILNPTILTPNLPSISLPFKPISIDCTFNGWKHPTKNWISWVDRLHSSYQYIWKRAGIYEAILCSKYKIIKNEDLFFGLVERWCSNTNTFVFSWGEATVTLEDVMLLGGYSVLGNSVSGSGHIDKVDVLEKKLVEIHQELSKGPSQKAKHGHWIKHFTEHGLETGVEHEAFLACWLSKFVLPTFPYDVVVKKYFRIAIVLASGVQIALAPVVLASIYRDLSLLKSAMINCKDGEGFDDLVKLTVWGPLQLVQVWAWERFPGFRPNPVLVEFGEPRLARWHDVNETEIGNVRPLLQSAGHSFEWRPYCKKVDNLALPFICREHEEWVIVDGVLGDDIKSLVRCLKVCDLVGMDTIEQYSPNRVAMQFGYDQDIPEYVKSDLLNSDISRSELMQLAWFGFISSTKDEVLYVPSIFYEPHVTVRYLNWFREGVLTRQAAMNGVVRKKRSSKRRLNRLEELRKVKNAIDKSIDVPAVGFPRESDVAGEGADVPPGFTPKNAGNELDCSTGFPRQFYGQSTVLVGKNDRCGLASEVVVKKESSDYTESRQPTALLWRGYQTLGEGKLETRARTSSGTSELMEIPRHLAHGTEDQTDNMDLRARIRHLEQIVADLTKAR